MTTIHLTDAQRDSFAAWGLIVIDGELAEECSEKCPSSSRVCGRDVGHSGRHETVLHPPIGGSRAAILYWTDGTIVQCESGVPDRSRVAPEGWRILTEPCPCGDPEFDVGAIHEARWDDRLHQAVWFDPDCTDCVGGRRVVTLTATCPKCHGDGGYIVHDDQGDECRHGRCRTCGAGMEGGGVVTLGRFTVPALLPVKHWSENDEETESCVTVGHDNGKAYMSIGFSHNECPLDPLPRPGQFIARPERVE